MRNKLPNASTVHDYATARAFLGGTKYERTVMNNTVCHCVGAQGADGAEGYAIQYHATDVVTYWRDGTITINNGGWSTVTTSLRLRAYLPREIHVGGTRDGSGWHVAFGSWPMSAAEMAKVTARNASITAAETVGQCGHEVSYQGYKESTHACEKKAGHDAESAADDYRNYWERQHGRARGTGYGSNYVPAAELPAAERCQGTYTESYKATCYAPCTLSVGHAGRHYRHGVDNFVPSWSYPLPSSGFTIRPSKGGWLPGRGQVPTKSQLAKMAAHERARIRAAQAAERKAVAFLKRLDGDALYKVCGAGQVAIGGGHFVFKPGKWAPPVSGQVRRCLNGYHVTDGRHVAAWNKEFGGKCEVWTVETWHGHSIREGTDGPDGNGKSAFRSVKLVKLVGVMPV